MTERDGKFIQLAELYNADLTFEGNKATFRYPVLGQGSIISAQIEDILGDDAHYKIRMIPTDRTLEVEVYAS